MSTINAQFLYDYRNTFASISGLDLSDLFDEIVGDPSPAGETPIHFIDEILKMCSRSVD